MKNITCEICGKEIKDSICLINKKEVCGFCFLEEKKKRKIESWETKCKYPGCSNNVYSKNPNRTGYCSIHWHKIKMTYKTIKNGK